MPAIARRTVCFVRPIANDDPSAAGGRRKIAKAGSCQPKASKVGSRLPIYAPRRFEVPTYRS